MTQEPAAPTPATPYPETADIETSSDDYATRFTGPVGAWMLEVQEHLALHMLGPEPGKILDVGGGHGQLAKPLAERGTQVTVLGSDPSCSHRIRSLIDDERCHFVTGNVVDLPFEDDTFDSVLCFRLLTHCQQWPQLIRQLTRVARHRVVVDYPTSQSVNAIAPALFGTKKRIEVNTRTWRLFKHAEIESAFADCGYGVKQRNAQFLFPMVLHRAMKCRPLSAAMETVARSCGLTRRWGSPVVIEAVPVG